MSLPGILIILTSQDKLGDSQEKTGFHLSEMTQPVMRFIEAGFAIDFASPQGGEAPIDPNSLDMDVEENKAFMENPALLNKIKQTISLNEINISQYRAIYLPGGHGTMWDFPNNVVLGKILARIYDGGGIIGSVCHGPAAFVGTKLADGRQLVDGKHVTCFSNAEEIKVEKDTIVPFLLEDSLVEQGAEFSAQGLFQKNVVQDGRLITGQNPASAVGVSEAMIHMLRKENES